MITYILITVFLKKKTRFEGTVVACSGDGRHATVEFVNGQQARVDVSKWNDANIAIDTRTPSISASEGNISSDRAPEGETRRDAGDIIVLRKVVIGEDGVMVARNLTREADTCAFVLCVCARAHACQHRLLRRLRLLDSQWGTECWYVLMCHHCRHFAITIVLP